MSDRPLTPSEAHRKLVEIEREKDKTRHELHAKPRSYRRIVSDPDIVAIDAPPPISRLFSQDHGERLTRRKTVALSTRELLTILSLMEPSDNISNWIRQAILQRIEREKPMIASSSRTDDTTGRED